ncbi:MAG: hypothetical protein U0T80_00905 [Flavobacteriaceae bacterium]
MKKQRFEYCQSIWRNGGGFSLKAPVSIADEFLPEDELVFLQKTKKVLRTKPLQQMMGF